jgi:hypothetical protein
MCVVFSRPIWPDFALQGRWFESPVRAMRRVGGIVVFSGGSILCHSSKYRAQVCLPMEYGLVVDESVL